MYLNTQDWPTIYKLSLEDPLAARSAAPSGAGTDQGRTIYESTMPVVSWSKRRGIRQVDRPRSPASSRLELEAFRQIVTGGRGDMPAFRRPRCRGDRRDSRVSPGYRRQAPNHVEPRRRAAHRGGGPSWRPEERPADWRFRRSRPRYEPARRASVSGGRRSAAESLLHRLGSLSEPAVHDGSAVVGDRRVRFEQAERSSGECRSEKMREPPAEGAKNAGVFMAERHGIIVTSTGLLFVATTDGKVRAHDEETGRILWTASLPAGSGRAAGDVQVNGRQYLVVPASSRINTGGGHRRPGEAAIDPVEGTRSYVAFALPRRSKVTSKTGRQEDTKLDRKVT